LHTKNPRCSLLRQHIVPLKITANYPVLNSFQLFANGQTFHLVEHPQAYASEFRRFRQSCRRLGVAIAEQVTKNWNCPANNRLKSRCDGFIIAVLWFQSDRTPFM
jgi:hypothetical protein